MAAYREKADLIAIGAYQPGTDPLTDAAIAAREPIDGFLRQLVEDRSTAEEADAALSQLTLLAGAGMAEAVPAPPAQPSGPGTPLHAAIPPLHLAA
jgi:flagellum-specific ATP synthase